MSDDQQTITAEYLTGLLEAKVAELSESGTVLTDHEAFLYSAGAAWALQLALMLQQGHKQEPSNLEPLLVELVRELRIQNDYHSRMERSVLSLSTHQQSQEKPTWVESSTHENISSIPEDDIYDVGGVKYLKKNSQTQVSGHTQAQAKRANKAKGGDVSYTPETLCLDTGFKQCVEAGLSKSKLAERFGVSESTVARAKRKL